MKTLENSYLNNKDEIIMAFLKGDGNRILKIIENEVNNGEMFIDNKASRDIVLSYFAHYKMCIHNAIDKVDISIS